ncbi:MAG: class I SAM-dependent methyltransferase [Rhodobiaceae bacterium]|nr:class I SAM-dependent methyltransferase [Rhodobiaceae bacterium]MCC0053564.1 class I SAM-dependent methyltransferase [Rhodobiaceae bacterium]
MTRSERTKEEILSHVYAAETAAEQKQAYDAWASTYERDIMASGIRLPFHAAATFIAHVRPGTGPILDAGCGTGMQSEALALLGYGPLHGFDLSDGMLAVARAKGLYETLVSATLGEPLPLPDGAYAATYCIGVLTPGHAPANAIDELVRVTARDGLLVLSLRHDEGVSPYLATLEAHRAAGRIAHVFSTPEFVSIPISAPQVRHAIHVWRRT